MLLRRISIAVIALFVGGFVSGVVNGVAQTGAADHPYQYFRIGNSADAHRASVRAGFALMGGGEDLDEAFRWMCQRSGGGDFLVVRARGNDDYNPYIQKLCHENSAATLIIPDRAAAADPFVEKTIRNAQAIFIAGGDQSNYIKFWTGTPVQSAINDAIRRGVPIGGTSAGLAVLAEFSYTAQADAPGMPNLKSSAALANPFHPQVTIARDFLKIPVLHGVITDSHFSVRDRLGRSLVFMARILESGDAKEIRALGIDQQTAILLDADGKGAVIGIGAAYLFTASATPSVCKSETPLSFGPISVSKFAAGGTLDLASGRAAGISYILTVDAGKINSTQPGGSIY